MHEFWPEEKWERLFRKVMGKYPTGTELSQFKRNYLKPLSFKDEKRNLPEDEAADSDNAVRDAGSYPRGRARNPVNQK